MAKFLYNKSDSTIKTCIVHTGTKEDVASLVASALILSTKEPYPNSSACNCHIENDHVQNSTAIIIVKMDDDICHDAEQKVITEFFQLVLGDTEYEHQEDMNTIDCNHIRIDTFIAES